MKRRNFAANGHGHETEKVCVARAKVCVHKPRCSKVWRHAAGVTLLPGA